MNIFVRFLYRKNTANVAMTYLWTDNETELMEWI